ncbi:MAG: hypothetical protein IKF72_05465 [Kiritimatiellae bacterium]|nr:hypothetical protein [Kiritimatiellia bacterium]
MINAVSEQFNKFVSFAQEQIDRGERKAIATKGDVLVGGGTPLEERRISTTDNGDFVCKSIFRGRDTKKVNNEVRALFMKTIAEMFGGERNIPESVKTAMLLKDYGKGKPLTARRIIEVRDAIAGLGRANCFDKANDPDGQLAKKAIAAGYTRLDFGRLNTAANLLVATKGLSCKEAMEQVIDKDSAANRAMKAGSLYMKNAASFARGVGFHEHVALDDARNKELAEFNASEESAAQLSEIADNLEYKYRNILHDADDLLVAANLPPETLASLRTAVAAVADKFKGVSTDIACGALKGREEIDKRLFHVSLGEINTEVQNIVTRLRDAASQNPAIEEFRQYLAEHFKDAGLSYDKLVATYKHAVAREMTGPAEMKLRAAAADAGLATGTQVSIPKAIIGDLYAFLDVSPFTQMRKLESFCGHLEQYGDANLRFSDEQKASLKALVEKTFGSGPKADKVLNRLVERFETAFFAEQMLSPTDFGKEPPKHPDFIFNYIMKNPEMLHAFDPGFKLDTKEDAEAVKRAIKELMLADLNAKLADPDTAKMTSLSSGLMPQAVREYNVGYVTFNGGLIPNAELGTKFPQLHAESDTPMRKGYAEFLEKKFDAAHKKMRQTVSFACGMANGLGGTIDSMIEYGGEKSNIRGVSREELRGKGVIMSSASLLPEENYNIKIEESGDVKITLTHFVRNKVNNVITEDGIYSPRILLSQPNDAPVVGATKVVVTMTVRNASDAELGDAMPEFTIDDIRQEEQYDA